MSDKKPWERTRWEMLNSTPEGKEFIEKYSLTKEIVNKPSPMDGMTHEEKSKYVLGRGFRDDFIDFIKD